MEFIIVTDVLKIFIGLDEVGKNLFPISFYISCIYSLTITIALPNYTLHFHTLYFFYTFYTLYFILFKDFSNILLKSMVYT